MMEGLTCLGAIDKARPMLLFHYFSARTLIRAAQDDKQSHSRSSCEIQGARRDQGSP